jgi:hypothetical protein
VLAVVVVEMLPLTVEDGVLAQPQAVAVLAVEKLAEIKMVLMEQQTLAVVQVVAVMTVVLALVALVAQV